MIQIAALLTCHNRKEKSLACLESLFKCTLPADTSLKVFVVDDGSTDGTGEALSRHFPKAHLIKGNGKLFWNRGMHLAWTEAAAYADFDYYLWINDDVILFPMAIEDLLQTVGTARIIGVGTMQSPDGQNASYGGRSKQGKLMEPNGEVQACYTFNGNLVLVPRSVYQVLGTLDPMFLHSMGDYDYALRALKKGIKNLIAPAYCGSCEPHEKLAAWCLPEVPIKKRLQVLYTPLANGQPVYYFKFEKRHYGLIKATVHFGTIHLRALFPRLWKHQI